MLSKIKKIESLLEDDQGRELRFSFVENGRIEVLIKGVNDDYNLIILPMMELKDGIDFIVEEANKL